MATAEMFSALEHLVHTSRLVIDRPRGTPHPRFGEVIYPLDYGYLDGTSSGDGEGIDVFVGSLMPRRVDAILISVDPGKRDVEVKVLLGCTAEESETVRHFVHRHLGLGCHLVKR
ncbi:inorganic pyrophosphatase [Granulicoccus sp. GXG6511]|uniref:inorganic pyrophosphatase n=1 Tax=Granulicoccus sp. GXG6511 TaxID=3381351 RepID=UPI003D7D6A7A